MDGGIEVPHSALERCRADLHSFFKSWFHCLDATVITLAFLIDVVLKGVLEEVGSLVVGKKFRENMPFSLSQPSLLHKVPSHDFAPGAISAQVSDCV